MRRGPLLIGALAALVVVAVVVAVIMGRGPAADDTTVAGTSTGSVAVTATGSGPPDATLPEVDVEALVDGVHHSAAGTIEPVRLAEGLVPPTNRWFSGLVFGEEPQPVFPRPLSVAMTGSGFSLGLPVPDTSERAIVGPHLPAVTVDAGADRVLVGAYDDASVTLHLLDADDSLLGRAVLAQGSPFVSLTADTALVVAVDVTFEPGAGVVAGTATGTAEVAGRTWSVVAPEGAFEDDGGLSLAAGEHATWYPLPDDASSAAQEALARAAADPVTGTETSYGVGDGVARTTIGYRTAQGEPTVHVAMPHHRNGEQPDRSACDLGTYASVYGTLQVCAGSELVSWAPLLEPVRTLDLDAVPDAQREVLVEQVRADVAATVDFPSDTYFGGKWLYRAATLVTLGEQLGADEVVAGLRTELTDVLREWTEPQGCAERDHRCFTYDPDARGVVGLTPSFGSEEFNDHHFHYGYHLAAAGMMAADDPALAADLAPVMDLLAQDIAAVTATEWLPRLRNFDVYAGHSWASGTSPFADGNNQESSSEAVNAWNGLGLWAQATGQDALVDQASWLMSTEAAAIVYWTDLDLEDPVYEGFGPTIVALNWGAKRDWATWFSGEPSAMLGILLIPMGPFADYLAIEPERIRASVAEAAPDGFEVQFGDYLLMYQALAGEQDARDAWEGAQQLSDESIDDGNSRAYLLAWIASHGGVG
ncbi:glycosyl hydrolase [Actinotalea sp. K2]|uniref:glycosyl hydrolase n=1 Tax=Actinotalea sp. K2 TaxID=2939438 RepID=UPI0020179CDA|nr:glycosyl hydrolase [Actinotalea sp. K2]MCL3859691.1 glycosyl hydrolase [Actinotalea sp. K2]